MDARNPVVRSFTGGNFLSKAPVVQSGHQFVVSTKKGEMYALDVNQKLLGASFRNANLIQEIDLGNDDFEIKSVNAISAEDAFSFELDVSIAYHIADALTIIKRRVQDTRADVRRLIVSAVQEVTRSYTMGQIEDVRRVVRRTVEGEDGTAAQKLNAAGYVLDELSTQLRRDPDSIAREIKRRDDQYTREDEIKQVEHTEKFLRGDMVTRLSYLASLGPNERLRAIEQLTEVDKEQIRLNMELNTKILEAGLQEIPEHQRKKLFDDVRRQLNQGFRSSPILGEGAQPQSNNKDPKGTSPSKEPDVDDWDDE